MMLGKLTGLVNDEDDHCKAGFCQVFIKSGKVPATVHLDDKKKREKKGFVD